MHDSEDLEIIGGVPAVPNDRASVLTVEIPILPPVKTGLVNLEGERQELLSFIHQADASLAVLRVALGMLDKTRAQAERRLRVLDAYTQAVEVEEDEDEPIAF